MWRMFANIYLYLPHILSNWVTRHVVEFDKFRFRPEFICNAVWSMFAYIYLYLPLFYQMVSIGEKRHVVEPDKLRWFKRHVVVYDQISARIQFVCCVRNVCKYLLIFTHYFLKWCQTRFCWVWWIQISARNHLQCCMWRMFANIYLYFPLILSNGVTRHVVEFGKLRFRQEFICNAVWGMFANIYLFLPLILSNEYDKLRFQPEIICNAVFEQCLQISIYFYH